MKKFGLLGRKLTHSYSPDIHSELGSLPYILYEKEPEDLESFILQGDWTGLNVTIPYKKEVLRFCQCLSPLAQALGSVNTLVRQPDGGIQGHNTDYFGFREMALSLGVSYEDKKALVLGSGGASVTAQAVLKELGCKVVVISRSGENNYGNLSRHKDAAILVNTTPVGMYPENGTAPVDLGDFPAIEAVLDVVYNPARTELILNAEKQNIPHASGLKMLVYQAAKASELFTGNAISREKMDSVYQKIVSATENIIFIGMPGCGKSTLAKLLADKLQRPFYDSDREIEQQIGMAIPEFFTQYGEDAFRLEETKILRRLGALSGTVIATGGGCVVKKENYEHLHQNGKILWVERELNLLAQNGRPVTMRDGVEALYSRRRSLYEAWSDLIVENNRDPEKVIDTILEAMM